MPRPCKRRRVCAMPEIHRFGPAGCGEELPAVRMTVDEFEAVRLIDLEGLNQEECAQRMDVARTTAQAIYNSARAKIAECLVMGKTLVIEGGEYILCGGSQPCCPGRHRRGCCKYRGTDREEPAEE